jgi:hypothetical protein
MYYAEGVVVDQDYREAVRLHRLAVDGGDAMAQWAFAVFYMRGTGVDQDDAEAARWFQLAANHVFMLPLLGCPTMFAPALSPDYFILDICTLLPSETLSWCFGIFFERGIKPGPLS